jgi:hypothetical protein
MSASDPSCAELEKYRHARSAVLILMDAVGVPVDPAHIPTTGTDGEATAGFAMTVKSQMRELMSW